jgi:hypothetical protein
VAELPSRVSRSSTVFGSAPRARRQDIFWEHARQTAAPRAAAAAAAQQDLFGRLATDDPPARKRDARADIEPTPAPARSASRVDALQKAPPAASVSMLRLPASSIRYAERRRTVNGEAVARLLEVTRGVHGIERPPMFTLPRGPFYARVDLWTDRPIGTPFVTGN